MFSRLHEKIEYRITKLQNTVRFVSFSALIHAKYYLLNKQMKELTGVTYSIKHMVKKLVLSKKDFTKFSYKDFASR